MAPEIGQAGFRMAGFIILVSVALLFVVPSGTPEYYVTILSLLMGALFAGFIALMVRLLK